MTPVHRRAAPADAEGLARLRWDAFYEEHPDEPRPDQAAWVAEFAAFAADALASERWLAWVADDGGRLVANVWLHVVPKVPRPSRATRSWGYVTNVFTVREARDAGVGAALLRALTEAAAAAELELLLVWPSERSVPFYERAGFAPTEALAREVAGHEE